MSDFADGLAPSKQWWANYSTTVLSPATTIPTTCRLAYFRCPVSGSSHLVNDRRESGTSSTAPAWKRWAFFGEDIASFS
jgi:hypothetical protein